ncbi:MAG: hypothetical protein HY801_10860 [Candidatus Lindowbacteria bacterium]|nr:hypothetical protein [Candidatus Lindowbacteria bacterium]
MDKTRSAICHPSRGSAKAGTFNRLLITLAASALFISFSAPVSPAADPLTPEQLVRKAAENNDNLQSYQARMVVHLTKGKQTEDSQYLFSFQKPHLKRMYVEKGKEKKSTVILRKDGVIRGKPGGMLSVVPPLTLKPEDKRLQDLWERRFYEADWGTLLKEIQDSLKDCSSGHVETVNGGKEFLLTIEAKNGDIDQAWFDHERLFLVKRNIRLANGDQLDAKWIDVALNPRFPDKHFDF